ncbi:MAG TPA: YncE family protein [Acidobacteriota bacterium]|jgi:DNA-binding beta-propeller fold protein YncE|nr:YncE family protein [Acidobacteriota bacterium]
MLKTGKGPYALRVSKYGQRLFVANFASEEVGILDLADPKRKTQTFYAGPRPIDLTLNASEDQLYVANFKFGLITVISLRDLKPIDNIKVGGEPVAITTSPRGDRMFVANWGHTRFGQVDIIDAASHQILKSVKVGSRPLALAVPANGEVVYVANAGSNMITRVELREYQTHELPCIENPTGLALSRDDKWLYVAGGGSQVAMMDVKSEKEVRRANVGRGPFGLVVHPKGWVATANKEDGTVTLLSDDLSHIVSIRVGKSPHYPIFSQDGNSLYVSLEKENKIAVVGLHEKP